MAGSRSRSNDSVSSSRECVKELASKVLLTIALVAIEIVSTDRYPSPLLAHSDRSPASRPSVHQVDRFEREEDSSPTPLHPNFSSDDFCEHVHALWEERSDPVMPEFQIFVDLEALGGSLSITNVD